jgi:hypothetical protein
MALGGRLHSRTPLPEADQARPPSTNQGQHGPSYHIPHLLPLPSYSADYRQTMEYW